MEDGLQSDRVATEPRVDPGLAPEGIRAFDADLQPRGVLAPFGWDWRADESWIQTAISADDGGGLLLLRRIRDDVVEIKIVGIVATPIYNAHMPEVARLVMAIVEAMGEGRSYPLRIEDPEERRRLIASPRLNDVFQVLVG